MRTQTIDTNKDVEKIQITLLREKNVEKRLTLALSLSAATIQLSKRAIERANPGINEKELVLLFVKYNYGNSYAEGLGKYFLKLSNEKI